MFTYNMVYTYYFINYVCLKTVFNNLTQCYILESEQGIQTISKPPKNV